MRRLRLALALFKNLAYFLTVRKRSILLLYQWPVSGSLNPYLNGWSGSIAVCDAHAILPNLTLYNVAKDRFYESYCSGRCSNCSYHPYRYLISFIQNWFYVNALTGLIFTSSPISKIVIQAYLVFDKIFVKYLHIRATGFWCRKFLHPQFFLKPRSRCSQRSRMLKFWWWVRASFLYSSIFCFG